jgi:sensor domain CHASE-containing protein
MNTHQISATAKLALSIGGVVAVFAAALFNAFRGWLASTENGSEEQRSIQDADLVGDYNFRTQRFDSGTDPAGWYEDER